MDNQGMVEEWDKLNVPGNVNVEVQSLMQSKRLFGETYSIHHNGSLIILNNQ